MLPTPDLAKMALNENGPQMGPNGPQTIQKWALNGPQIEWAPNNGPRAPLGYYTPFFKNPICRLHLIFYQSTYFFEGQGWRDLAELV